MILITFEHNNTCLCGWISAFMKHGTCFEWLLYIFTELMNITILDLRECRSIQDVVIINKLTECRQYCAKIVICDVNISSLMVIGCIINVSYISSFYSARKRPVPYYRPTPPSSSSDSDMDDWFYHHYRRSRSHSRHRKRSRSSSILHYRHRSRSIASDKGN